MDNPTGRANESIERREQKISDCFFWHSVGIIRRYKKIEKKIWFNWLETRSCSRTHWRNVHRLFFFCSLLLRLLLFDCCSNIFVFHRNKLKWFYVMKMYKNYFIGALWLNIRIHSALESFIAFVSFHFFLSGLHDDDDDAIWKGGREIPQKLQTVMVDIINAFQLRSCCCCNFKN